MNYRVLVCKYNELGLKSLNYQAKLLTRLAETIKKICIRENIKLQSILTTSGRILCFFPTQEIKKACEVFRYIIGIKSFAPAISSPRKINVLAQNISQYLINWYKFQNYTSFSLILKGNTRLLPDELLFLSELKSKISSKIKISGIPLYFKDHEADILVSVEIRKKGTYIYHQEIPTHFAGFPIESKTVFLLPWNNSPEELLAGMLLMRRGAIVIPFSLHSNQLEMFHDFPPLLKELAKYYADPLPYLTISESDLEKTCTLLQISEKREKDAVWTIFLEFICLSSIKEAQFKMNDRNLHFKGIILPNRNSLNFYKYLQIPILTPLVGFSQDFLNLIFNHLLEEPSNLSFHSLILNHISDTSKFEGNAQISKIDEDDMNFRFIIENIRNSESLKHELFNLTKKIKIHRIYGSILPLN